MPNGMMNQAMENSKKKFKAKIRTIEEYAEVNLEEFDKNSILKNVIDDCKTVSDNLNRALAMKQKYANERYELLEIGWDNLRPSHVQKIISCLKAENSVNEILSYGLPRGLKIIDSSFDTIQKLGLKLNSEAKREIDTLKKALNILNSNLKPMKKIMAKYTESASIYLNDISEDSNETKEFSTLIDTHESEVDLANKILQKIDSNSISKLQKRIFNIKAVLKGSFKGALGGVGVGTTLVALMFNPFQVAQIQRMGAKLADDYQVAFVFFACAILGSLLTPIFNFEKNLKSTIESSNVAYERFRKKKYRFSLFDA